MFTDHYHTRNHWTTLINEKDLENSVIEKIIRNEFHPTTVVFKKAKINWAEWIPGGNCFSTTEHVTYQNQRHTRPFFPTSSNYPQYPQLSTLTITQHHQCLRVLAAKNSHVHPRDYPEPSKLDYNAFEEVKELYEKEQIEYIKWAKLAWINGICIRALRPKPIIETVYEAEFKMRAGEVKHLPPELSWAAQISLETKDHVFEFVHKEDLIKVDVLDLPAVEYPEEMPRNLSILKPVAMPEPCTEHPCKFVLPNSNSVSTLPLYEIHKQLAHYCDENNAQAVASENALRCLLETHRCWKLPVSVVQVPSPDGELKTVLVMGSEFNVHKEYATHRTHKAYRHLLRHAFTPSIGHYKINKPTIQPKQSSAKSPASLDAEVPVSEPIHIDVPTITPAASCDILNHEEAAEPNTINLLDDLDVSSDDDDDRLLIDDRTVDDVSKSRMDPNRSEHSNISDPKTFVPTTQPKTSQAKSLDEELGVNDSSSHTYVENTSVTNPGSGIEQRDPSVQPGKPNVSKTNTIRSNHIRKLSFTDHLLTSELANKTNPIKASDKTQDSIEKSTNKPNASHLICKPIAHSNLEIKKTSPLKSCLKKPASRVVEPGTSRPKRNSTKLKSSDPPISDPKKDIISSSESDSNNDDSDSIPLIYHCGAKTKAKLIMTKTYGLRSRNEPKDKLAKIDKKKKNKIISNTEDTHGLRRSLRLTRLAEMNKNIQNNKISSTSNSNNANVTLRRSPRLNKTISSESEDVDEPKPRKSPRLSALKTHGKQVSYISPPSNSKSFKSREIDHSSTSPRKYSIVPDTPKRQTRRSSTRLQTPIIEKPKSPRKSSRCVSECCFNSKIDADTKVPLVPKYELRSYSIFKSGNSESRRKSLASNNLSNVIKDRKKQNPNRRHSVPFSKLTKLNEPSEWKAFTNELHKVAKRYFRLLDSPTSPNNDIADTESTNRTKKYTRRSNSSPKYNKIEMSDTDPADFKSKSKLSDKACLSEIANPEKALQSEIVNSETATQLEIANPEKAQTTITDQLNNRNVPESQGDLNEVVKFELDIELFEIPDIEINQNASSTNMTQTENLKITQDSSLPEKSFQNLLKANKKLQSKLHYLFSNSSDDSCDVDDDTGLNKHANKPIAKLDSTGTKELNQSEENLSQTEEVNLEVGESRQTEGTPAKDQLTNEDQTEVNDGDYPDQSETYNSTDEKDHSDTNRTEATEKYRRKTNSTISSDDYNTDIDLCNDLTKDDINEIIGVKNCACKGTLFEIPPPRSFKKWQLSDRTTSETLDVIVHMSHKVRKGVNETLLEPIVEYQPEFGGAKQTSSRVRSLALELMLRDSPQLLNVRVDYEKGDVILIEQISRDEFFDKHGEQTASIADTLLSALAQLRHLRPGQYVLDHDPRHGPNAMLYTTRRLQCEGQKLWLHRDNIQMPDADDANHAKKPFLLEPVLLPYHKYRNILPCAFPPYKNMVKKNKRKSAKKAKLPPQAMQWKNKKKKIKKVWQA